MRDWLKEKTENIAPPTLADYIQSILKRQTQAEKSGVSQSLYNLKDAANMLNFLTANNIMDMAGPDEKFSSIIGAQMDIQDKRKPIDRRLATLKNHIEQALFVAAHSYLKDVMNGKTTLPVKAWKAEYAKLTAERKTLNQHTLPSKTGKRNRANPQECLQYLATGTAATATTQDAGNRIVDRQNGG